MAYSKANRLSRNPERLQTLWKCIIKYRIDKVNNTIIRSFNSASRCMILHYEGLCRKVGHFALMPALAHFVLCHKSERKKLVL